VAGFLKHGRCFKRHEYVGYDGQTHWETRGVGCQGSDMDTMSNCSWQEVLALCEAHGIPRERMPDFSFVEWAIDVPLDQVDALNVGLRERLARLPREVVEGSHWLRRIVDLVEQGYLIFFCN
jgi:hypothetical protein